MKGGNEIEVYSEDFVLGREKGRVLARTRQSQGIARIRGLLLNIYS